MFISFKVRRPFWIVVHMRFSLCSCSSLILPTVKKSHQNALNGYANPCSYFAKKTAVRLKSRFTEMGDPNTNKR